MSPLEKVPKGRKTTGRGKTPFLKVKQLEEALKGLPPHFGEGWGEGLLFFSPLWGSCRGLLQPCFHQLFADALHAADGWVTILLLNVVQFDELHLVVLAHFTH